MPTPLPPRAPIRKKDSGSALLSIIATLLALLLVLMEAQAVGAIDWNALALMSLTE